MTDGGLARAFNSLSTLSEVVDEASWLRSKQIGLNELCCILANRPLYSELSQNGQHLWTAMKAKRHLAAVRYGWM